MWAVYMAPTDCLPFALKDLAYDIGKEGSF